MDFDRDVKHIQKAPTTESSISRSAIENLRSPLNTGFFNNPACTIGLCDAQLFVRRLKIVDYSKVRSARAVRIERLGEAERQSARDSTVGVWSRSTTALVCREAFRRDPLTRKSSPVA